MAPKNLSSPQQKEIDRRFMEGLIRFTAQSLETSTPVPFGALIVHTTTGEVLMRGRNAVGPESDPSAHAELRTVRKATKKLKTISLTGYTMYSTCEPCPMCMANALWAGLDRIVYGTTIADANRHCRQIQIPAKEVARRSDMTCTVEGPFLRAECYALFTHPNMLKAFATWSTRASSTRTASQRKRSSRTT
jgi:tRNA(Arg) A34 adenosine deaminase TadA